jgi:hypothetical protein
MKTRIELLLVEHDVVGASGDSLACRCDGRWRPVADYREHIADALLPLIREAQAEALEQFAGTLGVYAGDEDSEYWDGYRNGQRQAFRMTNEAAAAYRVGEER